MIEEDYEMDEEIDEEENDIEMYNVNMNNTKENVPSISQTIINTISKKYASNKYYQYIKNVDPYAISLDSSKFYNTSKSFNVLLKNTKIQGFLIDFKKRYDKVEDENGEKYIRTGLQLYLNKLNNNEEKYQFFFPFDFYFYVNVPKEYKKKFFYDLKISNVKYNTSNTNEDENNDDDVLLEAKSNLEINYSNNRKCSIKKVEVVKRHVFENNSPFLKNVIIFKLYFNTDQESKVFNTYLRKKYEKWFVKDEYGIKESDMDFEDRAGLDLNLRCCMAYEFDIDENSCVKFIKSENRYSYRQMSEIKQLPTLKRFVYDIEVNKKLNADVSYDDPIPVMSIKIGNIGYLLTNYELMPVSHNFPDYWYAGIDPENKTMMKIIEEKKKENENYKPTNVEKEELKLSEFREIDESELDSKLWKFEPCFVNVIKCRNEKELLEKFIEIFLREKPDYVSGYNSDAFDLNHIEHRMRIYNKTLSKYFDGEIVDKNFDGLYKKVLVFKRDGLMNCDAIDWMVRDSYLSKGNKKLKKATQILLKIKAPETDHEQHIIDTEKYLNILKKDPNNIEAYNHFWDYSKYCLSDSYITDIFIKNTIIDMNSALSILVPYTVWKSSRYPRGKQSFLKLAELMNGWGITGDGKTGFINYEINPSQYDIEQNAVKFLYKTTIEGQDEMSEGICLTKNEMMAHCDGCINSTCQKKWIKSWNDPVELQNKILCSRDTNKENEDDEDVCYYPLNNEYYPVEEEGYLGARVSIFNKGYFNKFAKLKFRIKLSKINELRDKYIRTLNDLMNEFENNNKSIPYNDTLVSYVINDKTELITNIVSQFNYIIENATPDPNDLDFAEIEAEPLLIHIDVASMYPSIIINWNLQPYSIVDEEYCNNCEYHYKEGERPCWFEHEWYPQYKVVHISKENREKFDEKIKNNYNHDSITHDKIVKLYKSKTYSMKGSKRSNFTYVFPTKSRVCQKSFKFFAYAVRDFRNQRYHYKYEKIRCDKEIERLYNKYKGQKIPDDVKQQINKLELESIYNRNLELGLKVLLNTYYGYLGSQGSKFKSLEVTGITTAIGKSIIGFAVEYCEPIGINIELDTDGIWSAILGLIPMTVKYTYSIKDLNTNEFIVDENNKPIIEKAKSGFNLFTTTFNKSVTEKFTNYNNYMPCAEDGVIYNNAGKKWNPSDNQSKKENLPINYDYDPLYVKEWRKHRTFKNQPICDIKFDYDGGDEGFLSCYFKGKKMYSIWKMHNGEIEQEETKGLTFKRNDGVEIIKHTAEKFLDKMNLKGIETKSITEAWIEACNVVSRYYKEIENHTLDPKYLKQVKSLSKTAEKVDNAYKKYTVLLTKYKIDPDQFHLTPVWLNLLLYDNEISIRAQENTFDIRYLLSNQNLAEKRQIYNECMKILDDLKTPQTMCAFRMCDMGLNIDTASWINSVLPYGETKNSFKVIPDALSYENDEIVKKYLFRWFGMNTILNEKENILSKYIDWNKYLDQYKQFIQTHIIQVSTKQIDDIYKYLPFQDYKKPRSKRLDSFVKKNQSVKRNINTNDSNEESEVKENKKVIHQVKLPLKNPVEKKVEKIIKERKKKKEKNDKGQKTLF